MAFVVETNTAILAVSLGGPAVLVLARRAGLFTTTPVIQRTLMALGCWVLVAIVLVAMARAGRPLSAIGLGAPTLQSLAWGIGGGLAGIAAFPLGGGLLRLLGGAPLTTDVNGLVGLPFWTRMLILVTAAVTEEVLYRGYPIPHLQALTGSLAVAAAISLAVFVIIHLPGWGLGHLIFVSLAGSILTALFLLRGDLWSCIIAHGIVDAVPLLIIPVVARRSGGAESPLSRR